MDVGLHKAGKHRTARSIDDFVRLGVEVTADVFNTPITNKNVTAHDEILLVHRHDGAAFDENRFAHEMKSGRADYAGIVDGL